MAPVGARGMGTGGCVGVGGTDSNSSLIFIYINIINFFKLELKF